MTEAEKTVWQMLRSRQIGDHRFRRQVPFGRYIADFVCHEARLIVEIDDGQHDQAAAAMERRRFLEDQGYHVLRFWNNDVLENREGIWTSIAAELERRHHPHPTLPHRGGGLSSRQRCEWRRFVDFSTAEFYELLRFRQAIFVVEQASPYPDLDGLDRRAEHLLLRVDGALSGCLRLIPYPNEKRVAIGRLAVAATLRRRGLARLMMTEALARCGADYPDGVITLSAQAYLVPFYEGFGFRPTSGPYDDYGVPHVDMALEAAGD
jgi:ElaA protein